MTDGKVVLVLGNNSVLRDLICEELSHDMCVVMKPIRDVERKEQANDVFEDVKSRYGQLDVVILVASEAPVRDLDMNDDKFFEDFSNLMLKNLYTITQLAQICVPHISKSAGKIFVLSIVAEEALHKKVFDPIAISNAGLAMLTKTIANELEGSGARVAFLKVGPAPENSNTCNTSSPRDIINSIKFMLSKEASYFHGSMLEFDGQCMATCI